MDIRKAFTHANCNFSEREVVVEYQTLQEENHWKSEYG